MTINRQAADALYRTNFGAFFYKAFEALNPGRPLIPNWHIDAICYRLQQMVIGEQPPRLVINLPPRTLKSTIVSIALPAWLLGRDPGCRIICASYADELANKFSRDCRTLIETAFYRRLFPATKLSPRKTTEGEFETTRMGFRLATSVGGTLTGRGGDFLIVDDPLKAIDAGSDLARRSAIDWLQNTAFSRLDNGTTGVVILAMQRLHVDDPSGTLLEKDWPRLVIPAVAPEPADYPIAEDQIYQRSAGEVLQPGRDKLATIEAQKLLCGSHIFAAQYQQNPTPSDGNLIKADWLGRYATKPARDQFDRVILTCDPSGKPGQHNDFTAITVAGKKGREFYLLDIRRGHWTILQMIEQIVALAREYAADLVVVEDTASGMGLIPLLQEKSPLNIAGRHPCGDKVSRLCQHLGTFEAGRILLPEEAPWLADFEHEILAFPRGRYDDQVDALLLLLDWFAVTPPMKEDVPIVAPVISHAPRPLREVFPDYSPFVGL